MYITHIFLGELNCKMLSIYPENIRPMTRYTGRTPSKREADKGTLVAHSIETAMNKMRSAKETEGLYRASSKGKGRIVCWRHRFSLHQIHQ